MKSLNEFFNIYTKKDLEKAKNQGRLESGRKRNIEIYQLEREVAQIQNWRDALNYAEDIHGPDRTELIRLYNEVLNDDTVSGFQESLKERILSSEFNIVDSAGNIKEGKEEVFDNKWFDEIVESFVLSILKGVRLIEVIPKNSKIDILENIFVFPDHYLIPQWREIMKFEGATENTLSYDPNEITLIEMGNPRAFGILNSIIPLYIFKKNAMQYWSNFQKKFGIPPVVGKTDLKNETSKSNMFTFLQQLANNSIGVIDNEDEVTGLNGISVDGYNTFNEMRKAMNEDIQRRLEGQTMTSQEGSSRAQAEVHERTGDIWFYGRLNRFKRMVNTNIIPLLAKYGFGVQETDRIRYKENKDVTAIIGHVLQLKQAGFEVDSDWLEETTGYPIETVDQVTEQSQMGNLENLYNSL